VRDWMNRIINKKVFNIVFSILVAIALWLYIAYAENTVVAQQYNNVDITFEGTEIISERNLVITNIDTEAVSLRIQGNRNAISKLSKEAISLTVDVSSITTSGIFQMQYDIEYDGLNSNALSVANASADYVTITVSKLTEKNVLVKGTYDVKVADGYNAEPLEFSPETILVSGPEELVSSIDHAWVEFERDTVSKTVTDTLSYVFRDKDDNVLATENLTVGTDKVTVTLPIVMVKDVALSVKLIPGAGASDANTKIKIEPSHITLSGDAELLESINNISLDTIDLSDFAASFTETYTIAIPNGLINDTGTTEATVTLQVLGLSTTRLPATNIRATNVTDGYTASIVTQSIDVTVRGSSDDIAQLKADNIRIEADLSSLGNAEGTFSVDAEIDIDGYPNVGAVGQYTVTVMIEKK